MKVEDQVITIYAVTKNYTIDIPVTQFKEFEKQLIDYADANYKELVQLIRAGGGLTDEITSQLDEMITKFKEGFKSEN